MSRFEGAANGVYSVFASVEWLAENIAVFPTDYTNKDDLKEFLRVSVVPSGSGVNRKSISGVVLIDIFYEYGSGPKRGYQLADILDKFLSNKSLATASGLIVQFNQGVTQPLGQDAINNNLSRMQYSIPFNYFGVL